MVEIVVPRCEPSCEEADAVTAGSKERSWKFSVATVALASSETSKYSLIGRLSPRDSDGRLTGGDDDEEEEEEKEGEEGEEDEPWQSSSFTGVFFDVSVAVAAASLSPPSLAHPKTILRASSMGVWSKPQTGPTHE